MQELSSQKIRRLAPEMDPLRMGMGWTKEDLEKPQILIESTYGDSHPGSAHLNRFVEEAVLGADESGGKAARYYVTDICDGMAQGHDGINYSLASRDMIANMIEIHGKATAFDAGVFIASCDKSVPAVLMGIGRLDLPSIVVTGGVMDAGPDLLTLEQIGAYSAMKERGGDHRGRTDLLQAARMSFLRGVLFYGDCVYHADHGRVPWSDAAGKRFDAGYV